MNFVYTTTTSIIRKYCRFCSLESNIVWNSGIALAVRSIILFDGTLYSGIIINDLGLGLCIGR